MKTCMKRRCCQERRCSTTVHVRSPGADGDPGIAPNPFFVAHSDIWMSDTADLPGPLGRNPVVFAYDIDWASVALLDPDGLDVASSCPLTATPGLGGEGARKIPLSALSVYGHLDNRDQIHIVSGSRSESAACRGQALACEWGGKARCSKARAAIAPVAYMRRSRGSQVRPKRGTPMY
jgi:hypothetical protein